MMRLYFLIFFVGFFFYCPTFKGQYSEALLKKAQEKIYENPDYSIQTGVEMLKHESDPNNLFKIYWMIYSAYSSKRDFEKSLDYALKMKQLIPKLQKPEQKIAILNTVASQYQQMDIYKKAIEALDESYTLSIKLADTSKYKNKSLGLNYSVRGNIYKSQNNNELSLEKLLTAYKYYQNSEQTSSTISDTSIVLYNIAYCYLNLEKYNEAEKFFLKSAEYAKAVNAESLEALAYKGLSELFTIEGKHEEAIKLLTNMEKMSVKIGDLILNEGIYKGLSDNYLANNDWENYELYSKKLAKAKAMRKQNELASINKSIEILSQENSQKIEENRKHFRIMIYGSLILTLIIIFFILKTVQKYRRENLNLAKKLHEAQINES